MKKVIIYTDGACSGNPGAGGWAAVLMYGDSFKEISGGESETTNNRMELIAAIKALELLNQKCEVELYSDSAYLVSAFNNGWLDNWKKNGWQTSGKEQVKNRELWLSLLALNAKHSIKWIKVKGHSDNEYNNRCDELARSQISRLK